ncbi:DUF937 domain-containing protein [Streptomyces sp. SID5785]|uniref:DUF937 domain-containing protein n=1 Tax=Streptomyces sp. SID5785 TaxID=2690309 RepID=UPI001360BD80|nr:DUF937 domain-containing protein [Streptomyces sp. SID5785]MZD05127.1 DUF937 domain-containing protein [Streptomyces sp. SID5785]
MERDVLDELGDDRLRELAGLLGTDASGAQDVVGSTVSALSGGLRERAEEGPEGAAEVREALADAEQQPPPLQGVATLGGLGGLAGGGLMAGLLSRLSRPVATAVAKRTGLPVANVARGIEMLIPVILAVLSKRSSRKR